MRAAIVTVLLLSLTSACGGDDTEGGDGDGDNSGDGGTSTGGTSTGGSGSGGTPGTGGSDPGDGDATVAEHEAACRSFCEGYQAQCGVDCPETCDGYANIHGEECAALGVDFFDCMAAEDPTTYDCDAGIMQTITDGCQFQQDDLSACRSLDGVLCERKPNYDEECTVASEPFAFFCVSAAVPANCSYVSTSTYCCPTE